VLDEYGCATEVIANPNLPTLFPSSDDEHSVVIAAWPLPTSERAQYTLSVLPRMVEKVLELTEEADAVVAADAIMEALHHDNGND
jgi:hypothetical protein